MTIAAVQDFRSLAVGAGIDIPHEKVTIITLTFMFWTVLVVFGARVEKDGEDN